MRTKRLVNYTKIIVSGRVQGVFYRTTTKDVADKLKLVGYVRNLPDGSVEIIAAGDKMEELIKWCHIGPRHSKVSRVETSQIMLDDKYNKFEIRY